MKKIINFLLISMCIVLLSSCYQDLKKDSLDEYILQINQNKIGFSSVEIDHPDYFLQSLTFIQDYDYIDAKYYWREDDPLRGLFTSNVASSYFKQRKEISGYFGAFHTFSLNEKVTSNFYAFLNVCN